MSGVNKGKLNQNLPLPSGWEIARDETGKIFYVDHIRFVYLDLILT